MTDRTRSRLGAYFLCALLLLTLPVALAVVHFDTVSKAKRWVRDGDSLKFVNVNSFERGVQYLMERDGISRDAAEKIAYQTQRETKTRLTDYETLPLNTVLDYYEIDGTKTPQTASYKGSAVVLDPKLPQCAALVNYWRNSPELKKERPEFLRFVESCLDKGFLLAPLGFAGTDPVDFKKARPTYKGSGRVKPAATFLPHVAIVATKFPGFRDIAPHSDSDTDPNDTVTAYIDYNTHLSYPGAYNTGSSGHAIGNHAGSTAEACYRSAAPPNPPGSSIPLYNWATTANGGNDLGWDNNWPYCHSIFDSVGGPFPASDTGYGIPVGIPNPWDWTYPAVMPRSDPSHLSTGDLQNYFYDLMYDQSTTSQAASNWFFYQTHGAVRPWGDRTDVIGWLFNGHQCNRYDWQTGGGNSFFFFPGTPVIRWGSDMDPEADPGVAQVVRATLSSRGLTFLLSRETSFSTTSPTTWPAVTAYTTADIDEATGTQTGVVPIDWQRSYNAGARMVMDPYDARRWTITNPGGTSWKFVQIDSSSPPSPTEATFTAVSGGIWDLNYGRTGLLGSSTTQFDITKVGNTVTYTYDGTGADPGITGANPAPGERVYIYNTNFNAANQGTFTVTASGANYFSVTNAGGVPQNDVTIGSGPLVSGLITKTRNVTNWKRNQFQGCAQLQNTEITAADLQIELSTYSSPAGGGTPTTLSRPKNRLLSLDYYTHAFIPGTTYQIKHLQNAWGADDDISGTVVPSGDTYRAERPYPFDHEGDDPPNKGYWAITGEKNAGNHRFGAYAAHAAQIMADNGISPSGTVIHVNADCPNQLNQPQQYVQPISSLYLNENDPRLTYFHEMGHAFCGFGDLYDMDFVVNQTPPIPNPLFHECPAMDPYSFMAMGGGRVDGWHVYANGYAETQAITQDTLGVQIPAVEGLLRDPIIIKVPANPYYIKWLRSNDPAVQAQGDPSAWQEFFLLENRNYNSSNSPNNGAWQTDNSPRGLYIYHIDTRGPGKWNLAEGGDQRDDNVLAIIVEQSDGKYELHYNNKGNWGNLNTDPFGARDAAINPSATGVTRFWQFPMLNGEINDFGQPVQGVATTPVGGGSTAPIGSPPSWSHGYTYLERSGGSNLLIPGTESDSFTRIVKISAPGDNMTCDIYVEPAEIQASRTELTTRLTRTITQVQRAADVVTVTTSAAHGFVDGEHVTISGVSDASFNGTFQITSLPAGNQFTYAQPGPNVGPLATGGTAKTGEVRQGATNVAFMKLTLVNPDGTGPNATDLSKMSVKDVYLDNLYCLESGTSNNPNDISLAKLYVDNNNNGKIDTGEPLLQSVPLTNGGPWHDYAVFTNLGYRLPLGSTSNLILAYDIAPEAQINPFITVGTEFTNARRIDPRLPGVVQDRQRLDANPGSNNPADPYNFGTSQFPLSSKTAVIVGYPDRLVVTGDTTNMPTYASQGQANLPMLKLNCAVNPGGNPRAQGSVRIDSIQVDEVGSVDAVADLVNCKLYRDNGDGVFDPVNDTVLATSSFTPGAPDEKANFPNLNLQVNAGTPVNLFLAVTLSPSATIGSEVRLSLKFPTEGPQPQDCYVQLINNPTESNNNKDYVWFDTGVTTDWPIVSLPSPAVRVIYPNQPPGAPQPPFAPTSPPSISDPTPQFSWGAASDPDPADTPATLRYELQVSSNPGFTGIVISSITPAGQTNFTAETTLAGGVTAGATSITVANAANLSSAFPYTLTIDGDQPDAEQVTVTGAVGNTLTCSPLVNDHDNGSACEIRLQVGVTYSWRVRAIDPQDAIGPWSVVQSFQMVGNRPPNQVNSGFVPPNATTVTTRTPTLSWNPTTDPDGTDIPSTLRYHVVVDDNNDYSSPNVDLIVLPPATTTYTIPVGANLQWGTTYYWKVTALDMAGAESVPSPQIWFRPVQDSAPYEPIAPFVYTNGVEVTTANPVLSWSMPNPPDVDPTDPLNTIHYIVQLKKGVPSSHSDMTQVSPGEVLYEKTTADDVRQWQVDHDDTNPAPTLNLEDNARYYWWVRAVDDEGLMSDWSAVQNFWVNLDNDPPNPPTSGFDPNNGEQISDSTPRIVWNHAVDPDPTDTWNVLHYVIELSPDNFATPAVQQYTTGNGQNFADVTTALTDLTMWYYRVKTIDDQGAESGWSDVQRFYLDTGNQLPTLTNPACVPLYGDAGTFFELFITYTDVENDMPDWVRCTITADGGDITLDMTKLNPGDNNAVDGIRYVVGVSATPTLGLGAHWNYFTAGINRGAPPAPVEQARQPDVGMNRGPIVGTPSTTRFVTGLGTNVDATTYQEGFPVFVQVADPDEDDDPGAPDTIPVVVSETAGDAEIVWLDETGNSTGIFEGTLPTLGRAGAVGDGVLNVRAGAAGNVITARYTDEDDVQAPPNATPDTTTDTATVIDTIAPAVVAGGPVVTDGGHGRSATVDWTGYPELAQADVAGYHIYYRDAASGGNFTDTTTPGLTMLTVPAGQFSRVVSGLTPGTQYWFAVGPFDEVPNETRTPVVATSVTTTDTLPPTISAQVPAVNATGVDRNTSISFNLDDPGIGIDQSSLVVTVTQNGNPVPCSAPVIVGNIYTMQVTVTPTAPLLWNATVNVAVTVSDSWAPPNTLITNWNFYTVTDFVAPTLDNQVPAPGATNVPVTTGVSFELHDGTSGINQSSVQLTFNGTPVPWASLSFSPATNGYKVTYDPPGDLSYSSTYTVSVTAADVAGNVVGPVNWSFSTVVDASSVVMDQFNPAQNATGVPIGTNVSLRLSDAQSGIQVATFRMWVYGAEVTGSPDLTIVQTPPAPATSASTMLVTYNPPADFPYATDIYVRVYVLDGVGNVADLTYKFTTADAPTYNISGLIEDQDGRALPGVTVTAGARTAVTDGTGAYRITGLLDGVYVVTPTRDQYDFAPVTRTVDVGPDDVTDADFVGTLRTYHIRGRITEDGVGVPGVHVTAGTKSADSDANGNYDILGLPNGTYTVTPTLVNYHFSPTTRAAQINGADVNNVDFTAIADTFSISGTIRDNLGNRVDAVQVTCGTKVAVTNAAGQYLISGLRAGNYTVTPTKAGYQMSPLSQVVGVPPDRTGIDFTANIEMVANMPAGLNLIGVPGLPTNTNPLNVFGAGNWIYRWNPNLAPPQWLVAQNNPTLEFMQVKAGRGFFVRFAGPTELRVAGVPTTGSVSIGLGEGWNMIANPRTMPTRFSSFVPSVPDGIRPYCFIYNNATGSYELVSSDPTVGALRDSLVGWEGAWVRATSGGVSLLVSAGAASVEPARPAQADLNGGWTIPIVARAGNRADVSSVAGVAPGSNDALMVENPPTAPETVDVYFTDAAGNRLAHDIRSAAASQVTFNFTVACNVPDTTVTLTLPDLSAVPRSQQVMLVDKTTGKSLYARTLPSYSYRSEGESSERQFQLIVQPHTIGALAVSAATAQATSNGVALSYTVTRAANVTIRVMNMAGRCIRVLAADKPVTAGAQTELWNLQSDSGTRVPAGTYLLQIEAVADNGQRVRGMTQVRVGR